MLLIKNWLLCKARKFKAFKAAWLSVRTVTGLWIPSELVFKRWVTWAKATSMANSSPENMLSVLVEAIVAEEIGNDAMLGLLIPIPITPFRAELSVKISWLAEFCAEEMASSRGRRMHGTIGSHGG